MRLKSTRDENRKIGALDAVLKGISEDGGLFIPETLPKLSLEDIERFKTLDYPALAAEVLSYFFEEVDPETMNRMTEAAYKTFDAENVVPLKKLDGHTFVMELYHGPTLAFKDVALQMLPRLMGAALDRNRVDEDVLILTATSGDTGKAALEGFKDVPRVRIVVFYPDEGVSDMQKLQMVTQEGGNTSVVAVKGNFDDTQNGVKHIFTDQASIEAIKKQGYVLSSANSINIGRLAPQIVYYFWSYICLLNTGEIKAGEKINISVPTGNFGNILAAYYAYRMGLPVNRLICASNTNRVLTDFFHNRVYRIHDREFIKTMSPSMDILISSNLERLIAEMAGEGEAVAKLMDALKTSGEYGITPNVSFSDTDLFYAGWADEKETLGAIRQAFDRYQYVMDPHTAVGYKVYDDYWRDTQDHTPCVIASTASPYKFAPSVLTALDGDSGGDAFEAVERLSEITGLPVPERISALKTKPVRHNRVIAADDMLRAVTDSIGKNEA